jgi:hypothetical protein
MRLRTDRGEQDFRVAGVSLEVEPRLAAPGAAWGHALLGGLGAGGGLRRRAGHVELVGYGE